MNTLSHQAQKDAWEKEHAEPKALLQMDKSDASKGVRKFADFLASLGRTNLRGIEMGCGKGRNVLFLAEQEYIAEMHGFDFSQSAIAEAGRRREEKGIPAERAGLAVADATEPWPFASDSFDFAVDCFASTDIESAEGRAFAISEFLRLLKPGGYLLAYLLSTDDEYHHMMIEKSENREDNSFINPEGKFEKAFTAEEIANAYKDFAVIRQERIEGTARFYGQSYRCRHFWTVFQKPVQ